MSISPALGTLYCGQLTLSTNFYAMSFSSEDWISQVQASRLRGVTRQAISKLVKRGRLRTLVIGGRVLVHREDVLHFQPRASGRPKGMLHNGG